MTWSLMFILTGCENLSHCPVGRVVSSSLLAQQARRFSHPAAAPRRKLTCLRNQCVTGWHICRWKQQVVTGALRRLPIALRGCNFWLNIAVVCGRWWKYLKTSVHELFKLWNLLSYVLGRNIAKAILYRLHMETEHLFSVMFQSLSILFTNY